MGRPSHLTDELAEAIVNATRAGMYIEQSAQMAGITGRVLYLWMAKGRHDLERLEESDEHPSIDDSHTHAFTNRSNGQCWCGHTRYSSFVQALKVAEARAEFTAMAEVRAAFAGNWTAAMTYLERRFPARWSRRDRSTVTIEEPATPEATAMPEMPMRERMARTLAILDRAGRAPSSDE